MRLLSTETKALAREEFSVPRMVPGTQKAFSTYLGAGGMNEEGTGRAKKEKEKRGKKYTLEEKRSQGHN